MRRATLRVVRNMLTAWLAGAPACNHPKGNPLFRTPELWPDIPHAWCQMHVFFKQNCVTVRDEIQMRMNAS